MIEYPQPKDPQEVAEEGMVVQSSPTADQIGETNKPPPSDEPASSSSPPPMAPSENQVQQQFVVVVEPQQQKKLEEGNKNASSTVRTTATLPWYRRYHGPIIIVLLLIIIGLLSAVIVTLLANQNNDSGNGDAKKALGTPQQSDPTPSPVNPLLTNRITYRPSISVLDKLNPTRDPSPNVPVPAPAKSSPPSFTFTVVESIHPSNRPSQDTADEPVTPLVGSTRPSQSPSSISGSEGGGKLPLEAYCGTCLWKQSSFTCDERVSFVVDAFSMSEESVKQSLLESGECVDPVHVPTLFSPTPMPSPTLRPTPSPSYLSRYRPTPRPTPRPSYRVDGTPPTPMPVETPSPTASTASFALSSPSACIVQDVVKENIMSSSPILGSSSGAIFSLSTPTRNKGTLFSDGSPLDDTATQMEYIRITSFSLRVLAPLLVAATTYQVWYRQGDYIGTDDRTGKPFDTRGDFTQWTLAAYGNSLGLEGTNQTKTRSQEPLIVDSNFFSGAFPGDNNTHGEQPSELLQEGGMKILNSGGSPVKTYLYQIPTSIFKPVEIPKYGGKVSFYVTLDRALMQYGDAEEEEWDLMDAENEKVAIHVGEGVSTYLWKEIASLYTPRRFLGKVWYEQISSIPCHYSHSVDSPLTSAPIPRPTSVTNTSPNINQSTPSSFSENELRLQQTLDYLITFNVSNSSMLEPHAVYTPQYQAARWISMYDQYRIPIPSTSEPSREEYPFLQRYSLAVLYFATGGLEHWLYGMNFLQEYHECNWSDQFEIRGIEHVLTFGVLCDGEPDFQDGEEDLWNRERTVTGVSLPPYNNMKGTLPEELRHLRYLKELNIIYNKGVTGSIPFQYGSLKHMSFLNLVDTSLSGKIPLDFAHLTKMKKLRLERNQLSANTIEGDLDFMTEMKSLYRLSLGFNAGIAGTLPDFVSNLSNLQVLSLSNTGLHGILPPSLSKLIKLKVLSLDDCAFEGSVDMIKKLLDLTHVYLEDNLFNDTIDDSFFAGFETLVHLDISNCSFSGSVPGHLFNLPQLEVLDMNMNNLSGELPADAIASAQSSKLKFLSLHSNNITGPIPTSIGQLKNVTTLDVSINHLMGDIPTEIGDLVDLDILFLGRNSFNEAPLPAWIQNMTQLTELSLKSSSLIREIPSWLGDMTNLKFLDLGENDLSNTIPQSLGNLSQLVILLLNANHLSGTLGLGQLENLETLLIDDNNLTGNTDAMCAHEITHFIADCAELYCNCCSLCCSDEKTCNDSEWLGNHEAVWEYDYERVYWGFEEGVIINSGTGDIK
mmetsp:Transcript_4594/g.7950  ORF Transcript_4594/g.7950 Transcript_4594/m.7950 type:complete len:1277 (+) Transcript_4594:628-4458(+)